MGSLGRREGVGEIPEKAGRGEPSGQAGRGQQGLSAKSTEGAAWGSAEPRPPAATALLGNS